MSALFFTLTLGACVELCTPTTLDDPLRRRGAVLRLGTAIQEYAGDDALRPPAAGLLAADLDIGNAGVGDEIRWRCSAWICAIRQHPQGRVGINLQVNIVLERERPAQKRARRGNSDRAAEQAVGIAAQSRSDDGI